MPQSFMTLEARIVPIFQDGISSGLPDSLLLNRRGRSVDIHRKARAGPAGCKESDLRIVVSIPMFSAEYVISGSIAHT